MSNSVYRYEVIWAIRDDRKVAANNFMNNTLRKWQLRNDIDHFPSEYEKGAQTWWLGYGLYNREQAVLIRSTLTGVSNKDGIFYIVLDKQTGKILQNVTGNVADGAIKTFAQVLIDEGLVKKPETL